MQVELMIKTNEGHEIHPMSMDPAEVVLLKSGLPYSVFTYHNHAIDEIHRLAAVEVSVELIRDADHQARLAVTIHAVPTEQ